MPDDDDDDDGNGDVDIVTDLFIKLYNTSRQRNFNFLYSLNIFNWK